MWYECGAGSKCTIRDKNAALRVGRICQLEEKAVFQAIPEIDGYYLP
jgi:hypothetical protein